jgi:choline-sulfatase
MHVVDGVGDPYGLLRGSMPPMVSAREDVLAAGPGESDYIAYDRAIADRAVAWLGSEGASTPEPWALWVSFVSPHFPLLSPERHWDRYAHADLPLPATRRPGRWSTHPEVDTSRRLQAHDEPYSDEQVRRATAAYLGLVSFVDEQVGRVLQALERSGLSDRTRVIYTSDHGEMLGEHGIWGKSVMLEGALGVPMIMAGPQIPSEAVRTDPVSLVDLFPTIVESTGLSLDEDIGLPGRSLFAPAAPDRSVFSEYHGECSSMGAFSMRRGTKKLIAYPDAPTQRFDLAADPAETDDQTSRRAWHSDFDDLERALRSSVDIERVDARARADQQALLERFGGAQAVIARGETVPFTPVPVEFLRDPP